MENSAAKLQDLSKNCDEAAAQLRAASRNTETSATKGTLLDIGGLLETVANHLKEEAARLGLKADQQNASAGILNQIAETVMGRLHPGDDAPALKRCYEQLTELDSSFQQAQEGHAEPDTRQMLIQGQRTVKESLGRLDKLISEQS